MMNNICPLCDRDMPKGSYNEHHLVPATFNGRDKITLHKICHDKIHHTISERELKNFYYTIELLLEHEEIKKFAKWVKKQPNDFYSSNNDTKHRKGRRRK